MQDAVPAAVAGAVAHATGAPVACHETHGSWVFVPGKRALKVKKPVVLAFLDYGTLERRRAMCREEVRRNRLVLRADRAPRDIVREVAAWLDRGWA